MTRRLAIVLALASVATDAAAAPLWDDLTHPNRRRCVQLLDEAGQARAHDQLSTAVGALRKAATLCADDREVLQALGEALLATRAFAEARRVLERVRVLTSDGPMA